MKKYNIYIAGRYSRKHPLSLYADILKERGHNITAEWLYEDDNNIPQSKLTADVRAEYARKCIKGITKSNMFVYFTDDVEEMIGDLDLMTKEDIWEYTRGGRHVELGFAMAWGMDRIIFIGNRENIFHYIEDMEQYDNFDVFIANIDNHEDLEITDEELLELID